MGKRMRYVKLLPEGMDAAKELLNPYSCINDMLSHVIHAAKLLFYCLIYVCMSPVMVIIDLVESSQPGSNDKLSHLLSAAVTIPKLLYMVVYFTGQLIVYITMLLLLSHTILTFALCIFVGRGLNHIKLMLTTF